MELYFVYFLIFENYKSPTLVCGRHSNGLVFKNLKCLAYYLRSTL